MAPTKIPIEAQQEIYELLSARLRISADELVAVLRKYGIAGEVDMLQDRYRRRLAQSLMASLRDEKGRREVFAVVDDRGETVYIPIDYYNGPRNNRSELKQIRQKMRKTMVGLGLSSGKVEDRLQGLDLFAQKLNPCSRKKVKSWKN